MIITYFVGRLIAAALVGAVILFMIMSGAYKTWSFNAWILIAVMVGAGSGAIAYAIQRWERKTFRYAEDLYQRTRPVRRVAGAVMGYIMILMWTLLGLSLVMLAFFDLKTKTFTNQFRWPAVFTGLELIALFFILFGVWLVVSSKREP